MHEAFLHYCLITAYSKQLRSYGLHNLSSSTLFLDSVKICKLFKQLVHFLSSFTMHFPSSAKVSFSVSFYLKLNTTKHTQRSLLIHFTPSEKTTQGLKLQRAFSETIQFKIKTPSTLKYLKSTLRNLHSAAVFNACFKLPLKTYCIRVSEVVPIGSLTH